ncbi:MAG TPA: methyltransferase domain-containing protein [Candidatus Ozemobacteraceae bacterium]|nr:methyltransferase domain-containing protein [Candidatus Ozemobacteraceae bacterium]
MKNIHLPLLRCIRCGGDLGIASGLAATESGDEIIHGSIACGQCGAEFPIVDGVCVFLDPDMMEALLTPAERRSIAKTGCRRSSAGAGTGSPGNETLVRTVENWSYQWNQVLGWSAEDFDGKGFCGEKCFREFIPIRPEEYRDRNVVIWCGGNGREAYHVARYSPALIVVVEIGDEIYRIRDLFGPDANLLLLRCDMLKNPLREGIADISICDHALQHIIDHRQAFSVLAGVLKPGGLAGVCAYSHENNFLMTGLVEPLKSVLHRLPLVLLRFLACIPALVIFFCIHFVYLPLRRYDEKMARRIPLNEHMIFWSECNLKFIWTACFDLLHAPVSYHFRRDEIVSMAAAGKIEIRTLENTHQTTWSMLGTRLP